MWFNPSAQSKGNHFLLSHSVLHGCENLLNSSFAHSHLPFSHRNAVFLYFSLQYRGIPIRLATCSCFKNTGNKSHKDQVKKRRDWIRKIRRSAQKTHCSHSGIFIRTCQQPCSFATWFQQQSRFKALSTMSGECMCSAKIHTSQQLQLCTFPSKVSCNPKSFLWTEEILVDLKASAQRRTVMAILRAVSKSC